MAFNYKGYAWQESMRKNLYSAISQISGKNTGSSNKNGGRKNKGKK